MTGKHQATQLKTHRQKSPIFFTQGEEGTTAPTLHFESGSAMATFQQQLLIQPQSWAKFSTAACSYQPNKTAWLLKTSWKKRSWRRGKHDAK